MINLDANESNILYFSFFYLHFSCHVHIAYASDFGRSWNEMNDGKVKFSSHDSCEFLYKTLIYKTYHYQRKYRPHTRAYIHLLLLTWGRKSKILSTPECYPSILNSKYVLDRFFVLKFCFLFLLLRRHECI